MMSSTSLVDACQHALKGASGLLGRASGFRGLALVLVFPTLGDYMLLSRVDYVLRPDLLGSVILYTLNKVAC